jgi:hypothetical protein
MTIRQLSVFIENKSGALDEILQSLKAEKIQIIASTISDTVEYGIYRIITSEPQRAYNSLISRGISVNLNDVFAISLDNKAGKAADVISLFSEAGISISYLYSFLIKDRGILVFRTDKPDETCNVITKNNLSYIREADLQKLC